MNIHPVTVKGPRSNRWCGPAVISIIAGVTTDAAAKLLRDLTGRRSITGTYHYEVDWALRNLGYRLTALPRGSDADRSDARACGLRHYGEKPTLAAWLRDTPRPAGTVFLVIAGNHYMVISGHRYCCGRVREIVSVRDDRVKRRSRVSAAYVVTEI